MYRLVKLHVGEILAEIPPYFDRERVGRGAVPLVLVCMVFAKPCADTTDAWLRQPNYRLIGNT